MCKHHDPRGPRWRDALIVVLSFYLCIGILVFYSGHANGATLTWHQRWALAYSRQAGREYGTTMQAIVYQESSLCAHKRGLDKSSYGCAQVRRATVASVLHRNVTISTLRTDDPLNIELGAAYLRYCIRVTGSWTRGVYAYNHGPVAAIHASWRTLAHDRYVLAIQKRMRQIEEWRRVR
ncbi:MAG: lytic transglycosylase domain-containing protein [Gammaproteobacteria bacterium]